jgi:hypothetical protein
MPRRAEFVKRMEQRWRGNDASSRDVQTIPGREEFVTGTTQTIIIIILNNIQNFLLSIHYTLSSPWGWMLARSQHHSIPEIPPTPPYQSIN